MVKALESVAQPAGTRAERLERLEKEGDHSGITRRQPPSECAQKIQQRLLVVLRERLELIHDRVCL